MDRHRNPQLINPNPRKDTIMNTTPVTGLPAGTETEEWRLLSAEISWALWRNHHRSSQISEQLRLITSWESAAPEFRSVTRSMLRHGETEGIKFTRDLARKLASDTDSWRTKTARLAWLFWLKNNRTTKRIPEWRELEAWKAESTDYRKYVRNVVNELEANGIYIHE